MVKLPCAKIVWVGVISGGGAKALVRDCDDGKAKGAMIGRSLS